MDKSENIKQHERKVMAKVVTIVMLIMASALMVFVYLVTTIRESKDDAIAAQNNAEFEKIYSEMQLLRSQSYDNCKSVTKDIEKDLRKLDLDILKDNMDNGIITDEVYEIIEKHARNVSLNGIDNYKNGITVMTQAGVLEDFNYERANGKEVRSWENEIEMAWNKDLEKDAINKILIHASKRIIAMEKNYMGKDHMMIPEMTKENLKKVFLAEGIEGLRNYQFKVACYITETGDIFGQEDIVHGIKQDTHKLIIVQEFNLYDQLQQADSDVFDRDNDRLVDIEGRYSLIMNITYILGLFFIASIIILLFYFSHMYNYYIWMYDNESDKNLSRKNILNGDHK